MLDAVDDDVDVVVVLGGGDDVAAVDVDGGERDGVVVAVLDGSPPAAQPASRSAPAAPSTALRIGTSDTIARAGMVARARPSVEEGGAGGSPGCRPVGAA